jgi:hypothetical protein
MKGSEMRIEPISGLDFIYRIEPKSKIKRLEMIERKEKAIQKEKIERANLFFKPDWLGRYFDLYI